MKRFMFFGVVFLAVILLAGGVFASDCSPSDRILRISNVSNAHGEVYNYGSQTTSSFVSQQVVSMQSATGSYSCTLPYSLGNYPAGNYKIVWNGGAWTRWGDGVVPNGPAHEYWGAAVHPNSSRTTPDGCKGGLNYQYSGGTHTWPDGSGFETAAEAVTYFVGQEVEFNHAGGQISVGMVDDIWGDNLGSIAVELFKEEIVGGSSYPIDICYSDIFGQEYTEVISHVCNPDKSNLVLRLSGDTNAHAEGPAGSNYLTQICYTGLENCKLASSCDTLAGETEIIRLSGDTNAHLAEKGYSGYSNLICCEGGGGPVIPGEITDAHWEDYAGTRITNACMGDTVRMVADSTFADGTAADFEIYEDDWIFDDYIDGISAQVSGGEVKADWEILDAPDVGVGGEFRFDALVGGVVKDSSLELLHIVDTGCENTPPTAVITGPEHRQIYFKDIAIAFNGTCLDSQGPSTFQWNILEDNPLPPEKINSGNFLHTFGDAEQKTISLKCTDTGGLTDEVQIAILVVGSPGILAYINQPTHKQIIVSENFQVSYSASDSYALDNNVDGSCSNPNIGIVCLAGNCPPTTKNVPVACDPLAELPVTLTPRPFDSLYFNWTWNDGTSNTQGLGKVSGVRVYGGSGIKIIDLLLSYGGVGLPGYLEKLFSREFELLTSNSCSPSGDKWYEFIDGVLTNTYLTANSPGCAGNDYIAGTADDCCEGVGAVCTADGCRISTTSERECGDYTEEVPCNNAPMAVYTKDPLWNTEEDSCVGVLLDPEPGVCDRVIQCNGCAWIEGPVSRCVLNKTITPADPLDSSCWTDPTLHTYSCGVYTDGADCGEEDISKIVNIIRTVLAGTPPPGECVNSVESISCSPTIKLPFFGMFNLIAGISLITIIYALYLARRK